MEIIVALQIAACVTTLAATGLIGNWRISGPVMNIISGLFFVAVDAYAGLWVCAAFCAALAVYNLRNYVQWRRAMRAAAMIAFMLLLATPPAEAKHHHRHHHRVAVAPAPSWSLFQGGSDVVSAARREIGNGAIYGRSNLWCATFMNSVLRRSGYRGTNSDMAASFASMPRTTAHVGAIAVMSRRGGGHVGVVSGFDSAGNPIIISGNNAGRVRESTVARGRVYAFVVPQ